MSGLVKKLLLGCICGGIVLIGTIVWNIVLALPLEAYLLSGIVALGLAMVYCTKQIHDIEKESHGNTKNG